VPYEVKPVAGGFKVVNTVTGREVNPLGRPLSHDIATKQFRLLSGLERGWEPTGEPSALTPDTQPSPSTVAEIPDAG
jgi:hypothetical protein